MFVAGATSYLSWAYFISEIAGQTVSKQAVFKRMNGALVNTLKKLVKEVIHQQAQKGLKPSLFRGFKNVWLQDSTSLSLPQVMFKQFHGNRIQGENYSVAKLNVVMNLLTGFCPVMNWTCFTNTEQSLSCDILKIARKGDLVIRDLGYFVLDVFKKFNAEGIYFLTRWRYGVVLFNEIDGKSIDLIKLLKGQTRLDILVFCGSTHKIPMRLVAIKIPDEQAALRRRRAKKDNHRAVNHSKEYFVLLGYVIYLTNVQSDLWRSQQVIEAYRLRWHIEILFKSWKSTFRLEQIVPEARTNCFRMEGWLYLILLYISWFNLLIYHPLLMLHNNRSLSLMRIAKWAFTNIDKWLISDITSKTLNIVAYFCNYDTRARPNANERLRQFLMPFG